MAVLLLEDKGQVLWEFFSAVASAAQQPNYENTTSDGVFPGIASEIRDDLLSCGDWLLRALQDQLSMDEIGAVTDYLDATRELPEIIFTKRGRGAGYGVLHSAWDGQRHRSIELFRKFEPRLREIWAKLDWDQRWLDEFI